jgi:polysaccharide export outer membrane protein
MKALFCCFFWCLALGGGVNAQNTPNSGKALIASTNSASSVPSDSSFSQRYPRYQLRPGDSFDLNFEFTPELNQTVSVQPDGYVALRDVGDIYVNGKTVPEVTALLKGAYGKVVVKPSLVIILKDFDKPYFIADGQVGRPGKYDLRGDTTVVQAIAIAGGFREAAKHSQVVRFRRVSDSWVEATLVDVKKMEKQRNLAEDLHLHPGDMLFVPKNRLSKVMQFMPSSNMSILTRSY